MTNVINGEMLRSIRERRGLSQQELAEISGVGIATIKRIESTQGPRACRSVSVERLARALQVEPRDLAEDSFNRIVELDGIEMFLFEEHSVAETRRFFDRLIQLMEVRERIRNGNRAKQP